MPIQVLGSLLIKIFTMVLFGFFLKKRGLIDAQFQKSLSSFLLTAVLPVSVLSSANSEFSKAFGTKLLLSAGISVAYYLVALVLATLAASSLKTGEQKKKIFITMSTFANTAFIGLPIVKEIYGAEGTMYAVVYNLAYQVFLFTWGVKLLSGQKKFQLKSLYTDVVTMISLAAIVIYVSPFRFPAALASTFDDIGNMSVPISMIIIGCGIADISITDLWKDKLSYLVSALRLLVFPLIMLTVLAVAGVDATLAATCIVVTALPAGSLNVVLAEQYGCEPKFAACTVIQTMILFVVTLPVVLFCIEKWIF